MTNDLERLARELMQCYWNDLKDDDNPSYRTTSAIRLAKHVSILILKARIELLQEILEGPDWYTLDKIKELEDEIAGLEKQ